VIPLYSCLRLSGLVFYKVTLISAHSPGPNSFYSCLLLSRQVMVKLGWDKLRFVHSCTSFRASASECKGCFFRLLRDTLNSVTQWDTKQSVTFLVIQISTFSDHGYFETFVLVHRSYSVSNYKCPRILWKDLQEQGPQIASSQIASSELHLCTEVACSRLMITEESSTKL
jgi:hypothetical protein